MIMILSDHPADTLKMVRESLCVAQAGIPFATSVDRHREHVDRIQRLIDDIDRQRPLGPDGKHDNRHTPFCQCEDE